MARKCDICGKAPLVGNKVSHAHNKSKKRSLPNLQNVRVLKGGVKVYVKTCTSCLRTGRITKSA